MRGFVSSVLVLAITLLIPALAPAQVAAPALETQIRAGCATEIASFRRAAMSEGGTGAGFEKDLSKLIELANSSPELSKLATMQVQDEADGILKCFSATILKLRQGGSAPSQASATPAARPTSPANLEVVNQCVKPLQPGPVGDGGLYGSMQNTCGFDVSVVYCIRNPAADNTSTQAFNCDKGKMGLDTIAAGARRATHVGTSGNFLWIACRQPATPRTTYDAANGLRGTCK